MSSQNEFLVQIPDKPNALQARLSNASLHLSHIKPLIEAGTIVLSGPSLSQHPQSAEEVLSMTGSILVIKAATEATVRQMLAEDPLARAGVWDLEKIVVTPMKCFVRKGL
ncbi:hypothetical protein F4680DRAFT_432150 [Xylaria scruposa]|nr:hypothetical protein F4680DRAFT_432150 [Xylaria scruposa]